MRLRSDTRAVAMVEFIVVFIPILVLFLCIIELTRLSIANLMMQRSAGITVRACAVIKDQPIHCDENMDIPGSRNAGQNPNQDDIVKRAAVEALKPLADNQIHVAEAKCTTQHDAEGDAQLIGDDYSTPMVAQSGTDEVDVQARFRCAVPLARDIVCPNTEDIGSPLGDGARSRSLAAHAKFGHQGARFDCRFARDPTYGLADVRWLEPQFF